MKVERQINVRNKMWEVTVAVMPGVALRKEELDYYRSE